MLTAQEHAADAATEQGYIWLKTEGPKYGLDIDRVDINSFNVGEPFACILHQALRGNHCPTGERDGYGHVMNLLFPGWPLFDGDGDGDTSDAADEWAHAHGFCCDGRTFTYEDLNASWARRLTATRQH